MRAVESHCKSSQNSFLLKKTANLELCPLRVACTCLIVRSILECKLILALCPLPMAANSTSSASNAQCRKRLYCPHCDEHVSRSLYYQHKQLYFDSTQHQWKRCKPSASTCTPSDVNFEFSPDEDHRGSGLTSDSTVLETEGITKYGLIIIIVMKHWKLSVY